MQDLWRGGEAGYAGWEASRGLEKSNPVLKPTNDELQRANLGPEGSTLRRRALSGLLARGDTSLHLAERLAHGCEQP